MNEVQELLPVVVLGMATPEEIRMVKIALESDAALRAEYAELELVLAGLGAGVQMAAPAGLKTKVLNTARASLPLASSARRVQMRKSPQSRRSVPLARALPWLTGVVAVMTAIMVFVVQPKSEFNVTTVAATADGGIIYANSGAMSRTVPAVLMRADGSKIAVKFVADKECLFKAAVSSDGLSYLLDSANNTVFIVEEKSGALIDRWLVPPNATALDVVGSTVVVRSNEVALIFRRNQSGEKSMVEARLSSVAKPNANPEAAVIDGDDLYTTDQAKGLIHVLSSVTGQERTVFEAPELPVSLAVRDGLWVLDAAGMLFKLELGTGAVLFEVKLEGTPQYLRLTDQFAFIADKDGFVSVVDLEKRVVSARKRLQNPAMGLSIMPDGHVAVALEKRGIVVLDSKLETVSQLN